MRLLNHELSKLFSERLTPPAVELLLKEVMLGKLSSGENNLLAFSPEQKTQEMDQRKMKFDNI